MAVDYGLPQRGTDWLGAHLHPHPYTREHARIFFGRGRQVRDLYNRISDPLSQPVILLYGQSGVGKSSLLEAGLLPRLESNYEVCCLRRYQEVGLLGTLRRAVMPGDGDLPVGKAWLAREEQLAVGRTSVNSAKKLPRNLTVPQLHGGPEARGIVPAAGDEAPIRVPARYLRPGTAFKYKGEGDLEGRV
jgi:hypothetical protein